jgi:hypothetical protein
MLRCNDAPASRCRLDDAFLFETTANRAHVWFEAPGKCPAATDKTVAIRRRNARRCYAEEGGTSSAQYLLDHIFVYRRNHRAFVRIGSLARDIRKSVPRYLRHLKADKSAIDRFKSCTNDFFPRYRQGVGREGGVIES